MRNKKFITLALAPLLMAGAALAQKVSADFDRRADFTKYKTYSWAPSQHPAQSPLWDQRITENIDGQLAAKGLHKVEGPADLVVTYNGEIRENTSLQGFGNGGRWVGGSFSVNKVTEREGTLVVDIYDQAAKQLVWRGIATETASNKPDKNISKLEKAITKMFSQYPPKSR